MSSNQRQQRPSSSYGLSPRAVVQISLADLAGQVVDQLSVQGGTRRNVENDSNRPILQYRKMRRDQALKTTYMESKALLLLRVCSTLAAMRRNLSLVRLRVIAETKEDKYGDVLLQNSSTSTEAASHDHDVQSMDQLVDRVQRTQNRAEATKKSLLQLHALTDELEAELQDMGSIVYSSLKKQPLLGNDSSEQLVKNDAIWVDLAEAEHNDVERLRSSLFDLVNRRYGGDESLKSALSTLLLRLDREVSAKIAADRERAFVEFSSRNAEHTIKEERLVRQKLETLVEEKRRQLGVMKEALEREKRRREAAEETIRFLTKSSHSTDIAVNAARRAPSRRQTSETTSRRSPSTSRSGGNPTGRAISPTKLRKTATMTPTRQLTTSKIATKLARGVVSDPPRKKSVSRILEKHIVHGSDEDLESYPRTINVKLESNNGTNTPVSVVRSDAETEEMEEVPAWMSLTREPIDPMDFADNEDEDLDSSTPILDSDRHPESSVTSGVSPEAGRTTLGDALEYGTTTKKSADNALSILLSIRDKMDTQGFDLLSLLCKRDHRLLIAVASVVSTLGNGREVAGEQVDNVIARILRVMQNLGCTIVVLRELISSDISTTSLVGEILRTNSAATKLLSVFVRYQCEPILRHCILPAISELSARDLTGFSLPDSGSEQNTHTKLVLESAQKILASVFSSEAVVPDIVKQLFSEVRDIANQHFPGQDAGMKAVGGIFFLRFFTPGIVRPESIPNCDLSVSSEVKRVLLVVAKIIQNLANGVMFGPKETKMVIFNALITQYLPRCRDFLEGISHATKSIADPVRITDERLETLKEDLQTFRNCFFDEAIAQRLGQELETSKDEDLFRDALVVVAGLSSDLILPEVPLEPPPEVPEPMGDRDARKALKAIVAEKLHRHTENADKMEPTLDPTSETKEKKGGRWKRAFSKIKRGKK